MNSPGTPAGRATQVDSGPIAMIDAVARKIADESGLVCTPDIQDLVIICYLGLLDSPPPEPVDPDQLLENSRRALIIWAWEQGTYNETLQAEKRPMIKECPTPSCRKQSQGVGERNSPPAR